MCDIDSSDVTRLMLTVKMIDKFLKCGTVTE